MKGLKAILSGTGLVSGVGGIAALTALNKAPTSSVLEIVEEKPQVEEKKEEVVIEETGPVMDVYVVGYKKLDGWKRPLVDEISSEKLSDSFIALDSEVKKCSMRGNEQGRSYVYWLSKQKKFDCRESFQWQDWFTAKGVKKTKSFDETKLSDEIERARNLRRDMTIFQEQDPDYEDEVFMKGCQEFYDMNFKDGLSHHFCVSLLAD